MRLEKQYWVTAAIVFAILILISLTIFSPNNYITGRYTQEECDALCQDNTQPYLSSDFPRTYNLIEEQQYYIHLEGEDDEGDEIYYTTDESKGTWDALFLYPNGTMDITPTNDDVGRKSVFIIPLDECSDPDVCAATPDLITSAITFYVENVNDPPNVSEANPEAGSGFTGAENASLDFEIAIEDDDYSIDDQYYNETFNYSFILDGETNYSETMVKSLEFNWTYNPGWYDAGNHNVTFKVYDSYGDSASYEWLFYVNNTNRIPVQNATFPNTSWMEDNESNDFNLDYYFYDLDMDDTLEFIVNVSSGLNYTVWQDEGQNYIKFIPDENWFGNQTLVINVSDGYDYIISNEFLLQVNNTNDAPIIEEIPHLSTASGYSFEYQVNATEPDFESIEYNLINNPDWLTILANGKITGLPPEGEEGEYIFDVNASDPNSAYAIEEVNLTVFADSPPEFEEIGSITTTENNLTLINVSVSDPEGDSFEVVSDFKFALYKKNDTLYFFNFTPSNVDVGEYIVNLNATDSWGLTSEYSFNLNITDINNPPELEPVGDQVAKIGKLYSYDVDATDADDDDLYYDINLSFVSINHDNGIISYAASADREGVYVANVSVRDVESATDYELINFTVTYNRPPELEELGYIETEEDSPWYKELQASDPDNDPLTFEANASIGLNSTTGIINYTPPQPGIFYYNITVRDEDDAIDWSLLELNVTPFNDPPYFNTSNLNITTMEENETIVYVEFWDEEEAEIILYDNASEFDFIKINNTLGKINYTPVEEGDYSFELIANDGVKNGTAVMNITVLPYNHPPELYSYSPSLHVPAVERDILNFSVNVSDPDDDELTFIWEKDGQQLEEFNSSNLFYQLGWYDAGNHELQLEVRDEFGQQSNGTPLTWSLVVEDLNRPPVYGIRVIDDFSDGIFQNCTNGSLMLQQTNSTYAESGTYVTDRIDFLNENHIHFNTLKAVVNNTNATNISFEYKKSLNNPPLEYADTISWSNWEPINLTFQNSTHSIFTFKNSSTANVTMGSRYYKFRISLNTSNTSQTPVLNNFSILYEIAETTIEQGSYGNRWITMDTFFKEYDNDNSLSYNATSEEGNIEVYFPAGVSYAKIEPASEDFIGEDYVNVTASDGKDSVSSGPIKIVVTKREATGVTTQYLIKTETKTVIRNVPLEKEVPVYEEFNLLVPKSMTLYENDTVLVPIVLDNAGNKTLYDVNLTAQTNMSDVDLSFTKGFFSQIPSQSKQNTTLIITSYKTRGSYDVVLKAESREPPFNDTAKIMMATIEAGEYNETQINTKIAYTKDLINDNLECVELTEMVSIAESYMAQGNNAKAKEVLDSAIESCKYLITADRAYTEAPESTRKGGKENPLMFLGVVLMLVLIIILVILYFVKYSIK